MASALRGLTFYFGPPNVGKTLYYWRHHQPEDRRVCPAEEFLLAPDMNLRQLVFCKVIPPLLKEKHVILDGCNWSETRRESIISLVQRKHPHCPLTCLKLIPRHGKAQLLWQREIHLAEWLECKQRNRLEKQNLVASDEKLQQWSEKNRERREDHIDEPREEEGFTIQEVMLPLTMQSTYQLEVPCLLVEWSGICRRSDQGIKLATGSAESLRSWHEHNPAGRVLLLADANLPPGESVMERHSHIQFILQLLIDGAPKCPVFLYSVECSVTAGSFHQPPHPGMLVFLMRLLHLDYQHPASIYLYDTIPHLKMATAAGLKYLKASQFFKRPQMAVRFGPSVSRPSVPVLLQDMEMCVPVGDEWKVTPQIPLAEQVDKQSSARPMSQNLGHGRRLYLAVKKAEVFHRYEQFYKDHCTLTGGSPSKLTTGRSYEVPVPDSRAAPLDTSVSSTASGRRGLPKWMNKKEEKAVIKKTESVPGKKDLSGQFHKTPMRSLGSSTVYVMSPAEMLAYAQKIWCEAGNRIPSDNDDDDSIEGDDAPAADLTMTDVGASTGETLETSARKLKRSPTRAPAKDHQKKKPRVLWPDNAGSSSDKDGSAKVHHYHVPDTCSSSAKSSRSSGSMRGSREGGAAASVTTISETHSETSHSSSASSGRRHTTDRSHSTVEAPCLASDTVSEASFKSPKRRSRFFSRESVTTVPETASDSSHRSSRSDRSRCQIDTVSETSSTSASSFSHNVPESVTTIPETSSSSGDTQKSFKGAKADTKSTLNLPLKTGKQKKECDVKLDMSILDNFL